MTLLFFNIPATGHVNPSLGVVRELVHQGMPVLYYNTQDFAAAVRASGAEFRPYPVPTAGFVPGRAANPFVAAAQIVQAAEHLLPHLLAETRALQPTCILYDSMTPWGNYLAQLLGVPAICSCSIFMVNRRNATRIMRHPGVATALLAGWADMMRGQWAYQRATNRLKKRWGVTSPHPVDFFTHPGHKTLVYNSRFFQTGGADFDHTFEFVGAAVNHRPTVLDIPESFLAGGPVVYVSLGTLFNNQMGFFRTVLQAFANTPYRVVVSLGEHVRPTDLGDCPPNVWLRAYNPQIPLLQRAAVFVTHGGMNSVAEATWFGVPMVVVPQMGDQIAVAHRLHELGAAEWLATQRVTANHLLKAVNRVATVPTYRQHSATIGQSLREAGGAPRAAAVILDFVHTGRHVQRH